MSTKPEANNFFLNIAQVIIKEVKERNDLLVANALIRGQHVPTDHVHMITGHSNQPNL